MANTIYSIKPHDSIDATNMTTLSDAFRGFGGGETTGGRAGMIARQVYPPQCLRLSPSKQIAPLTQ